jgi:hypothetical protein
METMAGMGVSGHLTFTTGWEWGYWLVDWSIARWSWCYADNGSVRRTSPLTRLDDLFPDPELRRLWRAALAVQHRFLKERELLRYLAALTPFSELPHPFDKPFQPEPAFRYSWLLNRATQKEAETALRVPLADLDGYADEMERIAGRVGSRCRTLRMAGRYGIFRTGLPDELLRGMRITSLRARHRALTLRALMARRSEHGGSGSRAQRSVALLEKAREVRQQAQVLVRQQEGGYRYPVELIGRRRPNLTAYPFGYLYPASNLFFWEREEEQIRQERFDALFMNLWDMRRTLGLESLLFK